ncbi:MAG: hypothetical protein ACKVZJ_05850 [Phycisphaerales bacterium]
MNRVTVHTNDNPSTEKPPAQSGQTVAASLSGPAVSALGSEALPVLNTPLAPSEVLERLLALAKRGKLAGYAALDRHPRGLSGAAFRVSAFGQPYDRELIASVVGAPSGGSRVEFESRLLRKLPAVMIVLTILTIQPGLWLTDSMLRLYFSWYRIETWWWYLPLVLMSLPMMWKQFKKSEAAAHEDGLRAIEEIRAALK